MVSVEDRDVVLYRELIENLLSEISDRSYEVKLTSSEMLIITAPRDRLIDDKRMTVEDYTELENILDRIVNEYGYIIPHGEQHWEEVVSKLKEKGNKRR